MTLPVGGDTFLLEKLGQILLDPKVLSWFSSYSVKVVQIFAQIRRFWHFLQSRAPVSKSENNFKATFQNRPPRGKRNSDQIFSRGLKINSFRRCRRVPYSQCCWVTKSFEGYRKTISSFLLLFPSSSHKRGREASKKIRSRAEKKRDSSSLQSFISHKTSYLLLCSSILGKIYLLANDAREMCV